jgi:uncharacterized protein YegL
MNNLIRYKGGELSSGNRPLTVRRKGIVYLLIDISDSMNGLVGPRVNLAPVQRQEARDGATYNIVSTEDIAKHGLKTKLQVVMAGINAFTEKALANKLVGIVLFSSAAKIHQPPTYNKQELIKAISLIESHPLVGGSTNLSDAIALLNMNIQGHIESIETVVIVTDGKPDNNDAALTQGNRLKDLGTEILVIATEDADWGFLEQLRSRPDLSIRTTNENLEHAIQDAGRMLKP